MRPDEIKYILVADCHLRGDIACNEEFFSMLDRISSLLLNTEKEKRPALVFMGDIFELWIAIRGYESTLHEHFLSWCGKYKEEFSIFFIEGNHEFFISRKHGKNFTYCTKDLIREQDTVFLHGDLINSQDWKYRSLRILIRNPFTEFLLWLFADFGGRILADRTCRDLKGSNLENKKYFPAFFMEKRFSELFRKEKGILIAGHFHEKYSLCSPDHQQHIHTLPAWDKLKGSIGILSRSGKLITGSWHELLADDKNKE